MRIFSIMPFSVQPICVNINCQNMGSSRRQNYCRRCEGQIVEDKYGVIHLRSLSKCFLGASKYRLGQKRRQRLNLSVLDLRLLQHNENENAWLKCVSRILSNIHKCFEDIGIVEFVISYLKPTGIHFSLLSRGSLIPLNDIVSIYIKYNFSKFYPYRVHITGKADMICRQHKLRYPNDDTRPLNLESAPRHARFMDSIPPKNKEKILRRVNNILNMSADMFLSLPTLSPLHGIKYS